jgi:hypothetical protein
MSGLGYSGGIRIAVILGLLFFGGPQPAQAIPVRYDFIGTVRGGSYGPDQVPLPYTARLVVTDAAVASGGLQVSFGPGSCPSPTMCVVSGNPSGLISFGYGIPDFFGDPPRGAGFLHLDVNFLADGTLRGGIVEHGANSDFDITGTDFDWSGTFSSDSSLCGPATIGSSGCTMSGYWISSAAAPVSEPPSGWLVAGGLVLLLAMSRKNSFVK